MFPTKSDICGVRQGNPKEQSQEKWAYFLQQKIKMSKSKLQLKYFTRLGHNALSNSRL
jgi:hypothetical protein